MLVQLSHPENQEAGRPSTVWNLCSQGFWLMQMPLSPDIDSSEFSIGWQ